MKSDSKSIEDIKAIRKIMEESSRFLYVSGLAGIIAGITAIAGAVIAYFFILHTGTVDNLLSVKWQLIGIALAVLIISVLFAIYFPLKKARRNGKNILTPIVKKLLLNFVIPLATGGIFVVMLLFNDLLQLIIPCFLIFYGLALVNGGKFTFGEVFYLGILEIITGLVAAFVPGWGLIFWILGFGILHIIYGLSLYRKYKA